MKIYLLTPSPNNEDFLLGYGYARNEEEIANIIEKEFDELFFTSPEVVVDMDKKKAYGIDTDDGMQKDYYIVELNPVK